MRTIVVAALALVAAGCSNQTDSLVVVDVNADAPLTGVASLAVTATAGKTVSFTINPPAGVSEIDINPSTQTFGIDLPKGITGSIHVHVDAIAGDTSVMASGEADTNIKAGRRADLPLMLISTNPESDMGNDLGGGPDMAPMPGAPVLMIDRTKQAFGNVTVGHTSATVDVVITNTGETPTSALTFTPSGASLDQFSLTSDCGAALMPNATCKVTTSFAPTSTGDKSAHFDLTAAMGGTVGADVTGTGTPQGTVSISPDMQSCGSALLNTTSTTMAMFTVTNIGTSATGVPSVSTSDPQFTASGCTAVLQPQDTCTVTVTFKPVNRGMQTASVSAMASPGGTANASATGTGLKPATFSVNPSSYMFPTAVARNSTGATKTFVVTNVGDVMGPTLSASTITGTNAASFNKGTDGCSATTLAANGTCSVDVQLAPVTSGSLSATLNINASSVLATASLAATGTPIWVQEAAGTTGILNWVSGSDASNVMASGLMHDAQSNPSAIVLARNAGTGAWTSKSASPATSFGEISVGTSTVAWTTDDTELWELNGSGNWIIDNSPNSPKANASSGTDLAGVFAVGSTDVFATVTMSATSTMYHFTAANGWVTETTPAGASQLWGTSASDMFAYGGFLSSGQEFPVIIHRDGTGTWTRQYLGPGGSTSSGLAVSVSGVSGVGKPATALYASVSGNGPLQATSAGNWTSIAGFPSGAAKCYSVYAASTTAVFFVCSAGVYQYDGTTWGTPFAPAGMSLTSVWGSAANNVYVVGDDGNEHVAIYHLY